METGLRDSVLRIPETAVRPGAPHRKIAGRRSSNGRSGLCDLPDCKVRNRISAVFWALYPIYEEMDTIYENKQRVKKQKFTSFFYRRSAVFFRKRGKRARRPGGGTASGDNFLNAQERVERSVSGGGVLHGDKDRRIVLQGEAEGAYCLARFIVHTGCRDAVSVCNLLVNQPFEFVCGKDLTPHPCRAGKSTRSDTIFARTDEKTVRMILASISLIPIPA